LPLAKGERLRALFGEIVTPHIGDGLKLAWHLTKSSTDAEDVVQEACLNALGALETYQTGNARNWFLTIVRHAAYNWLRKNRRMRLVAVDNIELVEEENAQAQDHQTVTPETQLIARHEAHQLSQMLEAMPDPFREALELRIKQQHSYREISVILNVPVGTVMSRLARARQHLLTMVQNDRSP
jgi:RNA polymerase sigma-70 factor (ECF subfamily)